MSPCIFDHEPRSNHGLKNSFAVIVVLLALICFVALIVLFNFKKKFNLFFLVALVFFCILVAKCLQLQRFFNFCLQIIFLRLTLTPSVGLQTEWMHSMSYLIYQHLDCPLSKENQGAHLKFERPNGKNTKSNSF